MADSQMLPALRRHQRWPYLLAHHPLVTPDGPFPASWTQLPVRQLRQLRQRLVSIQTG